MHGDFRKCVHRGAPVCHSLISSFTVLSGVAAPGSRDACSNWGWREGWSTIWFNWYLWSAFYVQGAMQDSRDIPTSKPKRCLAFLFIQQRRLSTMCWTTFRVLKAPAEKRTWPLLPGFLEIAFQWEKQIEDWLYNWIFHYNYCTCYERIVQNTMRAFYRTCPGLESQGKPLSEDEVSSEIQRLNRAKEG